MNGQQNYYPNYSYMGYGMPNYMQRSYMQVQPPMHQPQMQQQNQMVQQQEQQQVQPQVQVQQQPQISMQAQQPTISYNVPSIQAVRYATEDEAKAFILYPNFTAIFIDEAKGKVYVKSANQGGFSSIRTYSQNIDGAEQQQAVKPQEKTPQVDYGQFASKEQLKGFATIEQYNALAGQYNSLVNEFKKLQNQVMGVKSNVANTGTSASNK